MCSGNRQFRPLTTRQKPDVLDAEIIITIIDFLILSLFFIHCTSVYRDIEDGLCMSVA